MLHLLVELRSRSTLTILVLKINVLTDLEDEMMMRH